MAGRQLLAEREATKTIFNNGWAPDCGWWASGAFNISIVPGAGVGKSNGLCTTFPEAEVSGHPSFENPHCCKVHCCRQARHHCRHRELLWAANYEHACSPTPCIRTCAKQRCPHSVCFAAGLDVISVWWLRWSDICFEQILCC